MYIIKINEDPEHNKYCHQPHFIWNELFNMTITEYNFNENTWKY